MNRLVRGIVAGSVIGAAVGVVMLMRRKPGMMKDMRMQPERINDRARGTVKMVRDNARRWTSAVKDGTEAFSRKLAHRTS
ncbi:MAG: YtxH domain-containing protein [Bacillota bacterium]